MFESHDVNFLVNFSYYVWTSTLQDGGAHKNDSHRLSFKGEGVGLKPVHSDKTVGQSL